MKSSVLIVDDEAAARYGLRRALEREGYVIDEADGVVSAQEAIERMRPDVVLLDLRLASDSGLDYLPTLVAADPPPAVIVVTAHGNERLAVETIKKGAFDYLAKPFEVDELRLLVRNAAEISRLRSENERLRNQLTDAGTFGALIGSSPAMKSIYSQIEKIAPTGASVLITGQSGTGKEIAARELHSRSGRTGPFVAMNCAALPDDLIESELFGHEKGAFTGAVGRRVGKFEAAGSGTLFLDEVGDMSLPTQAKLLRVLEEKCFQRLGSNEVLSSEVRIISATNRNLEDEVAAHRFREDLYYRICVVSVHMPALRERTEDIPPLAISFCNRYSAAYKGRTLTIPKEFYEALLEYDWPGNVRELRNCIERAVVLSDLEEITLNTLPKIVKEKVPSTESIKPDTFMLGFEGLGFREAKREFERKYIERCLDRAGGNITQAAAMLGIHRQSLQHKIKELGLAKRFVLGS